jgi:hypothetical protein
MTKANPFWRRAEEAMLDASRAKTEKEKHAHGPYAHVDAGGFRE